MNRSFYASLFALFALWASSANASVVPVSGGYEITYDIKLGIGSSTGGDILNTFIFEWDENNNFNVAYPYTIAGKGRTRIRHTISFEPSAALLMGYSLGIPGVGDEKDHLFTVNSSSFTNQVTGLKWSQAFPGVPPEPRIGHSAMISLLNDAASGDSVALDTLKQFIQTEGYRAGFDPAAGNFRVMEWTTGNPIDYALAVPAVSDYGLVIILLGVFLLAARQFWNKVNRDVSS